MNLADYNDLAGASWRKATYSNSQGTCVEVAEKNGSMTINGKIYVRDSKKPKGSLLAFTQAEWNAFIAGAKDGEFDLAQKR